MRRILVTGSRDWDDWATLCSALNAEHAWVGIIIHGGCPTGADRMVEQYVSLCTQQGWAVYEEPHPAQWKVLGRSAGPIRNAEMVALGADVCLAFIKNESKGATMTAELARMAGIPVKVYPA